MEDSSKDRKVRWRGAVVSALLGVAAYATSVVLSLSPTLSEWVLGSGFGLIPTRMLASATSLVPFSVAELLLGGYLAWLGFLGIGAIRGVRSGQRSRGNVLKWGARRLLRDAGIAVVLFFFAWGFNYSRAPLAERSGWPRWSEPSVLELTELTEAAVVAVNEAYEVLHGSRDAGSPTAMPSDLSGLEAAIRQGSEGALAYLPPEQSNGRGMPRARVKRPWSSGIIARLGMAGVFSPLTGEPHVVRGLPAASAVQTFAHERAHSWGFANEAEASYAGFLANAMAPDPLPRYASALFAANQLLRALARMDRARAVTLRARFAPGVDRDVRAVAAFWEPYSGIGQVLGAAVNDRYLRANRVAGGVDSYRRSSRLLVEFARQHGSLFPAPALPSE